MANYDNDYDHDDDNGKQNGDDELYDEVYTNENDDKFDYIKVKRKKYIPPKKKYIYIYIWKGIIDYINN